MMTLTVQINADAPLAVIEIQRTSHVDVESLPADTVVAYDVTVHQRDEHPDSPMRVVRTAPIWHRPADGALKLAGIAATAVLPQDQR